MTEEEVFSMAVKCYLISPGNREGFYGDALIQFAKLVAEKAIKETLAQPEQIPPSADSNTHQPEQEPVAWMDADGNVSDNNDHKCFPIPLYTHPPQRTWVDVPDEEIKRLWIQYRAALPRYLCFAKDLLSIAKEKNT